MSITCLLHEETSAFCSQLWFSPLCMSEREWESTKTWSLIGNPFSYFWSSSLLLNIIFVKQGPRLKLRSSSQRYLMWYSSASGICSALLDCRRAEIQWLNGEISPWIWCNWNTLLCVLTIMTSLVLWNFSFHVLLFLKWDCESLIHHYSDLHLFNRCLSSCLMINMHLHLTLLWTSFVIWLLSCYFTRTQ